MRSSGITVFIETSRSFIPFILHEEIQGILPVLILHPEDKRALRVILYAEGKKIFYPVYKAFQPQDLPQAFQFYKDIPVIHDIPDIPVIHDIPAFQALLHVPAPSSTNQYLPVLSSVSRDSTRSSISLVRMQILHTDWFPPETPLSTNRIQDILQTLHSSKKGRCCDIGHTFDIFSRIEFNSFKRLVFKSN